MVKSEPKIYGSPEPSTKCLPSTSSSESSSATNNSKKKKYKGVRMRSWGSWVSEIRAPNQKARIWLGSYSTAEAAARAYDAALLCIKGPTAANPSLNFPISTSHFQHMDNNVAPMSPKSIQRIAAAAAAAVTSTGAPQPPAPQQALSPSSVVSSPSMSCSSPSEDDGSHPPSHFVHESIAEIDSWCNFESPKYVDLMMVNNVASFDCVPPTLDDFLYEEGDIRLWNFC